MTVEDIALTMIPGLGVRGAVHLLDLFGTAQAVFAASPAELTGDAQLREDAARAILARKGFAEAERELAYCRRHDIRPIASTDPDYPALLREIPDYPHIIYIKGDAAPLSNRCLAVVGTRAATSYGLRATAVLVGELAERIPELTIVSGLAFGIDRAAHDAALAAGVPTVGVLANALPEVAPAQHGPVGRDIVQQGGALVTELHSQTKQNGRLYPARNRLIAGLCTGTLAVESRETGGSLLTAKYAADYDRTVMSVPGRITDPMSAGTNLLIRNMVAIPVLSADDIIRALQWDLEVPQAARPATAPRPELTASDRQLLRCFRRGEPTEAAELELHAGMDQGQLAATLLGLELDGVVRQLPGNRYECLIDTENL